MSNARIVQWGNGREEEGKRNGREERVETSSSFLLKSPRAFGSNR